MSSDYMEDYKEEMISEINIVPFVDIVLVLLIVFMISIPQMIREGLSIQLPQTSSPSQKIKSSSVTVNITHTGDIIMNGQILSLDDLSLLAQELVENNQASDRIVISADQRVSHGRVMEIIESFKKSGIQNFSFAVQ